MPHRTNNGRTLIALTLMAAGALWLLIATGFVPRTLLSVLANWWPLFLVGAGLDLALPRRRPLRIPYTVIASITVIALALLGVTLHGPTHTTYQLHRSTETRAATVTLQLSSAPTTSGSRIGAMIRCCGARVTSHSPCHRRDRCR